jgi:hypothetical protein
MNRLITKNCDSEKYENNVYQTPSSNGMKQRKIPRFVVSRPYV